MNSIITYLTLFLASIISGISVFAIKDTHSKTLKLIKVFGGAFLFAVCFVDLIPSMFEHNIEKGIDIHQSIIPVGAYILLGFLLQLLLEQLSKGAEHGHIHSNGEKKSLLSSIMLLIGISIHAFLEGFPIINNGVVNTSMVTGIIIHNIPISIVIVGAFLNSGCGKTKSILMLSIFASMAIYGSLLNQTWSFLNPYENIIVGIVVGILLHVSTTTLFDSEESHKYNLKRFLVVILAFIIVVLLPAH